MESRLKEEVQRLLDRAEQTLKASRVLIDGGYFGDAVSKVYYAMFYAARALLVQNDIIRHKHAAIISAIGQFFVKKGKLDAKFHQSLIAAFEDREMADYNIAWNATVDEAERRFLSAAKFIKEIKKII